MLIPTLTSTPARGDATGAFLPDGPRLRVLIALRGTDGGGRYNVLRMYEGGVWLPVATINLDSSSGRTAQVVELDVGDDGEAYVVVTDASAAPVEVWMHCPVRPRAPGDLGDLGGGVFDGAPDTTVLDVRQRAQVRKLLSARRLAVGAGAVDLGGSGGSGGPARPYLTVDEDGTLTPAALVLRSPNGTRFEVVVGDDGALSSRRF